MKKEKQARIPSKRQTEDSVAEKQAPGAMEKKEAHAVRDQSSFKNDARNFQS